MDIDKIILKTLNQKNSLEEYEMLEEWKAESEANMEFLNTIMSNNNKEHNITYKEFNKDAAWNQVEEEMTKENNSLLRYIPIALLMLCIAGAVYFFTGEKKADIFKTSEETRDVLLADNSKIWLNYETSFEVDPAYADSRNVKLSGEAYFEVEANQENPFLIALNNDDFIKVVGTSFNVLNRGNEFDLTVYSGRVELHTLGRVLELGKNDRVQRVNGAMVKTRNDDQNILSWKNKELIFDQTDLKKVFTDLGDHYNVEFQLNENVNTENCALRSRFKNQSIDQVLSELENIFKIKYTKEENIITITDLKCD